MQSTMIFSGDIGGDGASVFEKNSLQEETYKYSFTAQLRCLLPPGGLVFKMPSMKLFHNAFPAMDEVDSPGSAYGLEDVPELSTCARMDQIYLGPNRLNPDYKWLFKTPCYPADGEDIISWLEINHLPEDAYNLILWLNEIKFPTP